MESHIAAASSRPPPPPKKINIRRRYKSEEHVIDSSRKILRRNCSEPKLNGAKGDMQPKVPPKVPQKVISRITGAEERSDILFFVTFSKA